MIKMQLPETFGTATIHGMFYEMVARGFGKAREPRPAEDMQKGSFIFTQMNAILDQPILMRLPVGVDLTQLNLIAKEATDFAEWTNKHFGKSPRVTFV